MDSSPKRFLAGTQHCRASSDSEAIGLHSFEARLQPVLPRTNLIMEQTNGSVIVRNYDVDGAVVVNITERRASTDFGKIECRPSDPAYVAKALTSALVVKQQVSLIVGVGLSPSGLNGGDRAIGNEEVEP